VQLACFRLPIDVNPPINQSPAAAALAIHSPPLSATAPGPLPLQQPSIHPYQHVGGLGGQRGSLLGRLELRGQSHRLILQQGSSTGSSVKCQAWDVRFLLKPGNHTRNQPNGSAIGWDAGQLSSKQLTLLSTEATAGRIWLSSSLWWVMNSCTPYAAHRSQQQHCLMSQQC
jgi:hypothetical protein